MDVPRMEESRRKVYALGAFAGVVIGALFIHPLSMLFQSLVHPSLEFDLAELRDAFDEHHLPMALYFAMLGSVIGVAMTYLLRNLTGEKRRVKVLEELLPICCYCKKIRDDAGTEPGHGSWYEVEKYISRKTDTEFTHGICDACCEAVMKDIEEK
jgi:hypothetical protein